MISRHKMRLALSSTLSGEIGIIALLAITVWGSRYWYSIQFGLYEDDLTIIPFAAQTDLPDLLAYIINYIIHLYGHARPLSDSLILFFSHLGWKLAGLWGAYWIGYAIVALNACLFYWLLRRLHHRSFAVIGALAYALYSADSTQAYLTHSLGLQPSLMLLLLACHSYLSGRRWLAYLLAFVILFSYETPFTLFFAAPLLLQEWDRRLLKNLFWHALILSVMLAGVFLLRSAIGEDRITELRFPEMFTRPVDQMRVGLLVNLSLIKLHLRHAVKAVLRGEITISVALAFLIFSLIFWRLKNEASIEVQSMVLALKSRNWRAAIPEEFKELAKLAVAGLVMLLLSYSLTFTVPASVILGRGTRVHAAGVVGIAILIACAGTLFWQLLQAFKVQWLAAILIAGFFALQVGYGFMIQQEYILSRQYQQDFWSDLVPLVGDVDQQTVILVPPNVFRDTDHIGANTWNLPRILSQIYRFPTEWQSPPRVYRLIPDWDSHIQIEDCVFKLDWQTVVAPPALYQNVSSTQVIFIEGSPDDLVRRSNPLTIDEQECQIKASDHPGAPLYPQGFLFDYLIKSPVE